MNNIKYIVKFLSLFDEEQGQDYFIETDRDGKIKLYDNVNVAFHHMEQDKEKYTKLKFKIEEKKGE